MTSASLEALSLLLPLSQRSITHQWMRRKCSMISSWPHYPHLTTPLVTAVPWCPSSQAEPSSVLRWQGSLPIGSVAAGPSSWAHWSSLLVVPCKRPPRTWDICTAADRLQVSVLVFSSWSSLCIKPRLPILLFADVWQDYNNSSLDWELRLRVCLYLSLLFLLRKRSCMEVKVNAL